MPSMNDGITMPTDNKQRHEQRRTEKQNQQQTKKGKAMGSDQVSFFNPNII
jgi:hypothetical protein